MIFDYAISDSTRLVIKVIIGGECYAPGPFIPECAITLRKSALCYLDPLRRPVIPLKIIQLKVISEMKLLLMPMSIVRHPSCIGHYKRPSHWVFARM